MQITLTLRELKRLEHTFRRRVSLIAFDRRERQRASDSNIPRNAVDAIFLRDVIGRAGAWTVLLFLLMILSRAACPGCDAFTGLHVASSDPSGLTLAFAAWLNCLAFYFGARLPLWDDRCVTVLIGISKALAGLTSVMVISGTLLWMVRAVS